MLTKSTMLEAISPSILQFWRQVLLVSTIVENSVPCICSLMTSAPSSIMLEASASCILHCWKLVLHVSTML